MNNLDQIIALDSGEKGPIITIIGGIHGNEICGVEAIKKVLPKLKIKIGKIYFIFGNPEAIKENKRYLEYNLNRLFKDISDPEIVKSKEYQRAVLIRKYLDQSDICLDLHASTAPSFPFAITEENGLKLVENIDLNYICLNIDQFHPGGTDGYMFKQNKIGICIECGYLKSKSSTYFAEQVIWQVLAQLNMINKNNLFESKNLNKYGNQKVFQIYDLYLTKTNNFKLNKIYEDFELIKKGDLIGFDNDQKIIADQDFYILFAVNCSQKNAEAFVKAKILN